MQPTAQRGKKRIRRVWRRQKAERAGRRELTAWDPARPPFPHAPKPPARPARCACSGRRSTSQPAESRWREVQGSRPSLRSPLPQGGSPSIRAWGVGNRIMLTHARVTRGSAAQSRLGGAQGRRRCGASEPWHQGGIPKRPATAVLLRRRPQARAKGWPPGRLRNRFQPHRAAHSDDM